MTSSPSFRKIVFGVALSGLCLILLTVLYHIASLLLLLFGGVIFGVFIYGMGKFLADHSPLHAKAGLITVLVLIIGVFGGLGILLAPSLIEQTSQFKDMVPKAMDSLHQTLESSTFGGFLSQKIPETAGGLTEMDVFEGKFLNAFQITFEALGKVAIMAFVGFFLAWNPKLYIGGIVRLVPPQKRDEARDIIEELGEVLRSWLLGRFISMGIIGAITMVGLWALGVPLPWTLGLIAGLLSFIPNLGPLISFVPAALLGWMEGGNSMLLYVALLYGASQAFESYLITPMIQKKVTSVPPALLLSMQVLLGYTAGLLGLIFATPLLVVLMVLVRTIYVDRVLEDGEREGA